MATFDSERQSERIATVAKNLGAIVGLATLLFGIVKFTQTQNIEAAKPFLTKKLEWCEQASEVAAAIAIAAEPAKSARVERFWQLYWGVLGMVENDQVEPAMKNFGDSLLGKTAGKDLRYLSLEIAYACRKEMAKDWSPAWYR